MASQQQFPILTCEMQEDIATWAAEGLNGNRIHASLDAKYKHLQKPDTGSVVSRATVYNYLTWLREREAVKEWREPWSLGSMSDPKWGKGLDWTDVPLILKVWRGLPAIVDLPGVVVTNGEVRFGVFLHGPLAPFRVTVLEAQWITKLGRLAPHSDPRLLYMAAVKYAGFERYCRVHETSLDTAIYDLDVDLAAPEPFAKLVVKARIVMFPRDGDPDVESIGPLDYKEILDLLGPPMDAEARLASLGLHLGPEPERSEAEEA